MYFTNQQLTDNIESPLRQCLHLGLWCLGFWSLSISNKDIYVVCMFTDVYVYSCLYLLIYVSLSLYIYMYIYIYMYHHHHHCIQDLQGPPTNSCNLCSNAIPAIPIFQLHALSSYNRFLM